MRRQTLVGIIAALGLIFQIILGFVLAQSSIPFPPVLIGTHLAIGMTGLALVAFLLGRAYYSSGNGIKLAYILAFLLVVAQVALGFRVLGILGEGPSSPDAATLPQLSMTHQGLAFVILILFALAEMVAARQRRKTPPKAPVQVAAK